MLTIYLNNEPMQVQQQSLLTELLAKKDYAGICYAVFLNGKLVPRTQYIATVLQENDAIDIILPMQGG